MTANPSEESSRTVAYSLLTMGLIFVIQGSQGAWGDNYRLGPTQVLATYNSFGTGTPGRLRASESAVVWQVAHTSGTNSIQGFDFLQDKQITIRPEQFQREPIFPDVSGRNVIWSENVLGWRSLFLANLDSGSVGPIVEGPGLQRTWPSIDGETIVWEQFASDGRTADIYRATSPNWEPIPIEQGIKHSGRPDIDGGRIVYEDEAKGITVFDIGLQSTIFSRPISIVVSNLRPQIVDDFVAYRADNVSRVANFHSGAEMVLEDSKTFALAKELAVFVNQSNSMIAVNLFDGTQNTIIPSSTQLMHTAGGDLTISGNRVTWIVQSRGPFQNNDFQILTAEIVPEPGSCTLFGIALLAGRIVRRFRPLDKTPCK